MIGEAVNLSLGSGSEQRCVYRDTVVGRQPSCTSCHSRMDGKIRNILAARERKAVLNV